MFFRPTNYLVKSKTIQRPTSPTWTRPVPLEVSHWVAIYFAGNDTAEFFDSLGQKPETYTLSFPAFLARNSTQWTYNNRTLHSPFSNVCGQFCIYYLIYHCRRYSMSQIVHKFTKSLVNNDLLDADFVKSYFILTKSTIDGQNAVARYQRTLFVIKAFEK